MKTIGYAIVGVGYFGAELGRIMNEQEGARVVAVLDPENGETIAKEYGCDVETIWIPCAPGLMWTRYWWRLPTTSTRSLC